MSARTARHAAALRLAATRVEAGESLSAELRGAIAREMELHPEDAEEVDGFAANAASAPPDWHLEEVARREKDDDSRSEPAAVVMPRLLRQLRRQRSKVK